LGGKGRSKDKKTFKSLFLSLKIPPPTRNPPYPTTEFYSHPCVKPFLASPKVKGKPYAILPAVLESLEKRKRMGSRRGKRGLKIPRTHFPSKGREWRGRPERKKQGLFIFS
jgi:hypothetical protein